jgi:hypothetical protein
LVDNIGHIPVDFWQDVRNQRVSFDRIGLLLGVQQMEDWYHVNVADIVDRGCGSLLNSYYGGSLVSALQTIYPELDWQIWKFKSLPKSFWINTDNQRTYFLQLGRALKLKNLDDWHNVDVSAVQERGGKELLKLYDNSLSKGRLLFSGD